MLQRAAQCKYNGSTVPLGYKVDENDHFILDEQKAPIVLEIYERVAAGETIQSIMDDLNDRGIKTQLGNTFKRGSLSTVLRNEISIFMITYVSPAAFRVSSAMNYLMRYRK